MLPYQRAMLDPIGTGYTRQKTHYRPPQEIFSSMRGFGLDTSSLPTTDEMDNILYNVEGGTSAFATFIDNFLATFGIGAGRREADIIVPFQNRLMYNLGLITDQFRVGQTPTLSQLQNFHTQVRGLANNFIQFVLSSRFTDRRASGQALNTVMPYIDGSCGYAVPLGSTANPSQFNCISWGDGQLGGVGTNGMLGALSRAITQAGGSVGGGGIVINPPGTIGQTTLGISTPMLVGIGVLALFLFSRKGL